MRPVARHAREPWRLLRRPTGPVAALKLAAALLGFAAVAVGVVLVAGAVSVLLLVTFFEPVYDYFDPTP